MSVFKVQLTNTAQGLLDSAGQSSGTSIQRTVYIMGPGKVNRKLNDGATFTDSNYYKRFCYPTVPLDQAILTILTDDGSIYSDIPEEMRAPYDTVLTLTAGRTYTGAGMSIDILGTTGGYATYCQITPTVACKMRINGNVNAVMNLTANQVQIFDLNEMVISKLEFDNSASGATTGTVEITFSYQVVSNS